MRGRPTFKPMGNRMACAVFWNRMTGDRCDCESRVMDDWRRCDLGLRLNRVSDRQQDYGWAIEKTKSL